MLTIAAMIGSLACLLYIIVHLSFTKVYQTIKKLIRGADDDDPDDEPRVPRTKPRETKRLFAEKNAKGNHSDFSDDNFVMGHGKPKGTRYLREQINRGKSENVGPNTAGLEDEVAQCCKRSEQALGRASKRAYGTIHVSCLRTLLPSF